MMQNGHLKAPGNWINDPNGFIYYKGQYHLFYQHFPYGPRWGTMHWGHAVSQDLVNWEHKGIALFPTKYGDQNGCFSGSAVEYDGRLYLYYTGVHYFQPDPEDIHHCLDDQFESCQMMITSEDGMEFDNFHNKRMIIPPIPEGKAGDKTHTRDPKVWRGADAWYMVLGSRTPEGNGAALFYRSENLTEWSYINQASHGKEFGWMWECPDYFETEGGKVLVVSPMGFPMGRPKGESQSVCFAVDFNEDTCTMKLPDTWQFLDYGLDLYAPQSTVDEEGRRVMVAWLRMPEPVDKAWSGMFCLPRVVEVEDGHIYFRVHPNVKRLYSRKISCVEEAGEAGFRITGALEDKESVEIGGYRIWREGKRLCTDRTKVWRGSQEARMKFETPDLKDGCRVDIYVDPNLVEVYVNDGEYVLSHCVYDLKREVRWEGMQRMELYTVCQAV